MPGVEPPFPLPSDEIAVSVFVRERRVSFIGFSRTPWGVVPFSHHCLVSEDVPDGPVTVGRKETHSAVTAAIDGSYKTIMAKAKKESIRAAVESLVERARQGDQNAMGMIASVRDQAEEGNPRAEKTMMCMKAYIYEHPASDVGAEGKGLPDQRTRELLHSLGQGITSDDPEHYQAAVSMYIPETRRNIDALDAAGVLLANGPTLLADAEGPNARISSLADEFGAEDGHPVREAFNYGMKRSREPAAIQNAMTVLPKKGVDAMCVGYAMGLAKRIQAVRKGAPIAIYSVDAAWELGE